MKIFIFLTFFIFIYFIYGLYIAQNDISIVSPTLKTPEEAPYYDYRGIVNIHSDLSIGSSSISQIIRSAKQTKLDFVLFTDLNNFSPPYSLEGYHENTLVLIGQKISYLDSRFLVYSLKKESIGSSLGDAQIKLADLLSQNKSKDYLLILAHPTEKEFVWNGPFPSGLDGIEVVNLKSISQKSWEDSKFSVFWSLLIYPFNSTLALGRMFNEPTEALNLFDTSTVNNTIYGFAGAEASARAIPIANYLIRFPSYQKTFEIFSNHILLNSELTGNVKNDRIKLFNAFKNGNFYFAFDLIGKTTGFQCYISDHSNNYLMGSTIKRNKSLKLKIKIPQEPFYFYEIVIYKDGKRFATYNQKEFEYSIPQSGKYRIQVRVSPYLPLPDARKWITWIYTNPFNIID